MTLRLISDIAETARHKSYSLTQFKTQEAGKKRDPAAAAPRHSFQESPHCSRTCSSEHQKTVRSRQPEDQNANPTIAQNAQSSSWDMFFLCGREDVMDLGRTFDHTGDRDVIADLGDPDRHDESPIHEHELGLDARFQSEFNHRFDQFCRFGHRPSFDHSILSHPQARLCATSKPPKKEQNSAPLTTEQFYSKIRLKSYSM